MTRRGRGVVGREKVKWCHVASLVVFTRSPHLHINSPHFFSPSPLTNMTGRGTKARGLGGDCNKDVLRAERGCGVRMERAQHGRVMVSVRNGMKMSRRTVKEHGRKSHGFIGMDTAGGLANNS